MGQTPKGRIIRQHFREDPARWIHQDLCYFQVVPNLDYLRPIPYGYFDVNIDWIAGALDFYPLNYPAVVPPPVPNELIGRSEEYISLWLHDRQQEQIQRATELYDLNRFVGVSATVHLSLTEWLSLPAVVRDALVNEVNNLLREREKAAREARERLESHLKDQQAKRLQFPYATKLHTESYFR